MTPFSVICIVLLVVSALSVAADLIMESSYKIKNFGLEKTWLNFKGKTIPIEDFFPHNVLQSLVFIFIFSLLGLIFSALGMIFPIAIFCGIVFSMLCLFIERHIIYKMYKKLKGRSLPSDRPDAGDHAVCKEAIWGDSYGVITFDYKGTSYDFPAFSLNETHIEAGERVTVVDKEDGACWVEKIDEELSE